MTEINIDFGNVLGKIKPLHGFNNAARKTNYGEVLHDFLKLSPPIIRLHDTAGTYGGSHYVDIPNIFPDFSADANNPENYDFTLTDCYIKPLVEAGIKIMYRLGVTIEHEPKKYNIYAPADPYKWADICEHIVRHYNDGWADGYYWGIEFWEIWNEPDGIDPMVEPNGPPNWIGTAEDYYRLYSVTANHIKKHHPEVKVGGYSSCYILGANLNGKWTVGPYQYFTDFLSYISAPETKAPLDFFSWHGYLSRQYLEKIEVESEFVNKILNEYGFDNTLRFDTEWNCCICDKDTTDYRNEYYINMRTNKGASHVAGSLYEMQRLNVDSAMFYDAQLWCEYGCLFDVPSLKPSKTYYAFSQFDEMYKLGEWCYSESRDKLYSLAAKGEYEMVGISNISDAEQEIDLKIKNNKNKTVKIFRLSENKNMEQTEELYLDNDSLILKLEPYSFVSLIMKEEDKMKYKLVIFDLDGTILDTLEDLYLSVNYALNNNKLPERTIDEVRKSVGNGIRLLIERAVPENTPEAITDKVFSDFKEYYAVHSMDKTKPYDGIGTLLDKIRKAGIKTAVVSNKADFAVQKLISIFFDGKFDFVLGEKAGIKKKPAPDMVNNALEYLSVSPDQAVYVGDSEVDIETAVNSKIDMLIVDWGFRDRDYLISCGAAETISTVNELNSRL